MTIWFDRPIGAHADINELEYITALHQCVLPDLRQNGSIYAKDIVSYLMSRHGVRTTVEAMNDHILNGLAANLNSQQPPVLDIAELASILLIPHLRRASAPLENDEETTHDVFFKRLHFLFRANLPLDGSLDHEEMNEQGDLVLTPSLLQSFLEEHGEYDVPPQIIHEMISYAKAAVANTTTPDSTPPEAGDSNDVEQSCDNQHETTIYSKPEQAVAFSVETLTLALTSDLGLYDLSRELRLSTHLQDALATVKKPAPVNNTKETATDGDDASPTVEKTAPQETKETADSNGDNGQDDSDLKTDNESAPPLFDRVYIAPSIDLSADNFTSPVWVILVWILLVILYVTYVSGITGDSALGLHCSNPDQELSPFGCHVVNGLITWIVIFFQLTIVGVVFVSLASMGNLVNDASTKRHAVGRLLVSILTTFVTCILSYVVEVKTFFFDTRKQGGLMTIGYVGAMLLGLLLMGIQVMELLRVLFGKRFWESHPKLMWYATTGSIRMESCLKSAAVFKIKRMVQNALEVHDAKPIDGSVRESASAKRNAMFQFQMLEHRREPAGGVLWGWKKVLNGTAFTEEGVWLHARLLACNVVQLIVTIAVFLGWMIFISVFRFSSEKYAEVRKEVTLAEIDVALSVGAISAFCACAAITVVLIPSFISTCVQFRTGVIPSLRNNSFRVYRFSEDTTALLFGACFWGIVSTAGVCWGFVGGVTFIVVWRGTRTFVLILISNILGFLITYSVKVGVLLVLRHYLFRAFFRTRTALANFVSLALECWNLALSSGFILVRTSKLLLVTAFYLGRFDTPVLAPGVGVVGPLIMDGYPVIFRKDLLIHEAHRHPYMERLGMMYMMKLLHGESFACRAGSCWRLLMVLVLMPWLRKYRIRSAGQVSQLEVDVPVDATQGDDEEFQRGQSLTLAHDLESDREIELLRKRNRLQEKENEQLRELLKKATEAVQTQDLPERNDEVVHVKTMINS